MLRKLMIACLVAALPFVGGAIALAGGSNDGVRQARTTVPKVLPLADVLDVAPKATRPAADRAACRTIQCLNRRVNRLTNRVGNLQSFVNCLGAVGMTSFGEDPNGGTYGFVWRDDVEPDEFLTTALDFDGSDTPHVFTIVYAC
jgi:hypothetical protein